jgi:hyperosmotically inducible protein
MFNFNYEIMKKTVLLYFSILLSGIILFSCGNNDLKLQKEVPNALLNAPASISYSIKDGVVTLTGVVDSDKDRTGAEESVKALKDVKTVVNNIEVKAPAEPAVVINPDDALTKAITMALATGGFSDVVAAVKDGEVTLTGNVKRADLAKVMQIANEAKPKKVINQLTIK